MKIVKKLAHWCLYGEYVLLPPNISSKDFKKICLLILPCESDCGKLINTILLGLSIIRASERRHFGRWYEQKIFKAHRADILFCELKVIEEKGYLQETD